MKKAFLRALCCALMLALLTGASVPALADNISDAWAGDLFRAAKAVSGQIFIVRGGKPVYAFSCGYRDARKTKPANIDTKYLIASVTKMVSAVGLMRLYDQGWFALDDALGDSLGYPVVNTQYKDQKVTVRQLLSHTTGIKKGNTYKGNWAILSATSSAYYFQPNTPPGTNYEYSNRNGGLIGAMMEAITGLSVNTYMTENLFAPLGIDASYSADLLKDQSNISYQLNMDGTPMASDETLIKRGKNYDDTCDPPNHQGLTIGRLIISAPDLAKIGAMLCQRGEWQGDTILAADTVRLMEQDQREIENSSVKTYSPYGLCLERVQDSVGNTWYGHQGMAYGLTSDVFYLPEEDMTVVVIANGYRAKKQNTLVTVFADVMEKALATDWDSMPPCAYQWETEAE